MGREAAALRDSGTPVATCDRVAPARAYLRPVREEGMMATKGRVRVLGVNRDGLWIVEPIGSQSVDPLGKAKASGVPLEIKLSEPVTRSGRPKRESKFGGLRLTGGA